MEIFIKLSPFSSRKLFKSEISSILNSFRRLARLAGFLFFFIATTKEAKASAFVTSTFVNFTSLDFAFWLIFLFFGNSSEQNKLVPKNIVTKNILNNIFIMILSFCISYLFNFKIFFIKS